MPFIPWSEPAALPPSAEQKAPAPAKKSWWDTGMERWKGSGGFTMPWQAEHWANQPSWTRNVGKAGLGIGLAAGGAAAGMAAPGLMFGLGSKLPWLAKLAGAGAALAPEAGHLGALGALGGLGGLVGSSIMAPGSVGQPVPYEPPPGWPVSPTTTGPTAPPTLPEPGPPEGGAGPEAQPQVIEVGGQQFWWNPTGGLYGTGGWDLISGTQGLTPEQQTAQYEAQREHDLAMLKLQFEFEQQQQAASAAQEMTQMYAADPYKYWAQMGQGTPGAVSQLTGGEIAPGEPFSHTPMSTPSAQWWGNLLPSEQQQISGGLNWMGIDPQDWYSMYQRMIPGLGSRQMGPVWAR